MDSQLKDGFWNAVKQCLIQLHSLPESEAVEEVEAFKGKISFLSLEIVYHAEPFDIACDLAGKELNITDCRSTYDAILDGSGW